MSGSMSYEASQACASAEWERIRSTSRTPPQGAPLEEARSRSGSRQFPQAMGSKTWSKQSFRLPRTISRRRSTRDLVPQKTFKGSHTIMMSGFGEGVKWRHIHPWVTEFCGAVALYEAVHQPGSVSFVVMFEEQGCVDNALLLSGAEVCGCEVAIQPVKVQEKNLTVAALQDTFAGRFEDILSADVEREKERTPKERKVRRETNAAFEQALTQAVNNYAALPLETQLNIAGAACLSMAGAYYMASKKRRRVKTETDGGLRMILMELNKLGIE
eukprot:TRINITY_DN27753_c0_g1_i1.p1 TRINITY_DN27753_c0_g1~~TRINITY_DN27753_c0_g1_i1.p1  ORF type:complete len:272 (+),score=72.86 TRINITY_DN27753_c0_g1_i1:63-878(+)